MHAPLRTHIDYVSSLIQPPFLPPSECLSLLNVLTLFVSYTLLVDIEHPLFVCFSTFECCIELFHFLPSLNRHIYLLLYIVLCRDMS